MPNFSGWFGSLLYQLYNFTGHDYGFAIIIFTFLVRAFMMPLSIKQIKSSMKMQELQPELRKLQERYKNDREKLNQEMMKFFQENNYNPAHGCLPALIQLPILLILYKVISMPITNMLGGGEFLSKLVEATKVHASVAGGSETEVVFKFTQEIGDKLLSQNFISHDIVAKIIDLQAGMNFLGIFNLAKIPSYDYVTILSNKSVFLPLLLIPIVSAIFTYVSTKMMMNASASVASTTDSPTTLPGGMDPMKMQKTFLYIGPLMTLWFGFQLPAGLGLYWVASNLFQIFQQIYINRTVYEKKKQANMLANEGKDTDRNTKEVV